MCDFDQDEPVGDNLQSLKYKLSKVKELQEEVEKLREMLSNKYAEDWGANLNCVTQWGVGRSGGRKGWRRRLWVRGEGGWEKVWIGEGGGIWVWCPSVWSDICDVAEIV